MVAKLKRTGGRCDLELKQGVDYRPVFTVKDSAGVVVDITGYTARMQVRSPLSASTTLLDLTTANGGLVIDGPNGTITLAVTDTVTAALDFKTAVYDLETIDASGIVEELVYGTVTLIKEVTR